MILKSQKINDQKMTDCYRSTFHIDITIIFLACSLVTSEIVMARGVSMRFWMF